MVTDTLHVVHPHAAGLDVHKLEITATVRVCETEGGQPRQETRTFSALAPGLRALVAWLRAERVQAAVLESTGIYWLAPYQALEDAGIQPRLVHAQHVKQLQGHKTDRKDSVWLARVCQFELVRASFVPPRPFRELRPLSRHRGRLVSARSQVRCRVQAVLDRAGVRLGGALSDLFGVNGRRLLDGLAAGLPAERILASLDGRVARKKELLATMLESRLSARSVWLLREYLHSFDGLTARIAAVDREIAAGLADYEPALSLLQTLPGVQRWSACALLLELGPDVATTFPSAAHLAAWAGLAPGNHESAGKRRASRTRRGSPYLRRLLTECAHGAARTKDCQFHGYHKALTVRRGYSRAIVATAHKMLRALYAMFRDGTHYEDPEANYEELLVRRNAPRWIRALKAHHLLREEPDGRLVLQAAAA